MGEVVKLHGTWSSPFSYRVIWALKFKGIPFEYVEEDLSNKSPQLLHYNPVHKKIPVLVHGGKPICESAIILEYIEETWPHNPLMPTDPYQRAKARFWIQFAEDKNLVVSTFFRTTGEEQENAAKGCLEMLKTLEEHCFGESKFFTGDNISLADIAFGWMADGLKAIEEAVGVKLLEAHKFPRLNAWTEDFKNDPIIKENLPDYNKMLKRFKNLREKIVASA